MCNTPENNKESFISNKEINDFNSFNIKEEYLWEDKSENIKIDENNKCNDLELLRSENAYLKNRMDKININNML